MRPFTLSTMNISATSRPITIIFYPEASFGWGNAALGFGPGRIRTLVSMVSMATDSSHRVIIGKTVLPLFLGCFSPDLFILAGKEDMHESWDEFEVRPDPTTDCGVSCPLAAMGKTV